MGAVLDFKTGKQVHLKPAVDLEYLKARYVSSVYCNCDRVMKSFYSYCDRMLLGGYDVEDLLSEGGLHLDKHMVEYKGTIAVNFGYKDLNPSTIDSPIHDPLCWNDRKYRTTWSYLNSSDRPVTIHTKSDLIACDDYMLVIPKGSTIKLSIGGEGFPSSKRMNKAYSKLLNKGFNVTLEE